MPPKNNRSRNTFTFSSGDQFIKSNFCRFGQQNNAIVECLSTSQKTFLTLKLLQKCQEKIFRYKENQYEDTIQNQFMTNQVLDLIKPDTMKEAIRLKLKGSDRFLQFNKQSRRKSSQNLISSWTAFQNLDITYKTKQKDLLKENSYLHNKLIILENKLKDLYSPKNTDSFKNNDEQHQNMKMKLSQSNLQQIQQRIYGYEVLIQKLKSKIDKKQNQRLEIQTLLKILINKCQQKYGQQVVDKLKQMFQNQF